MDWKMCLTTLPQGDTMGALVIPTALLLRLFIALCITKKQSSTITLSSGKADRSQLSVHERVVLIAQELTHSIRSTAQDICTNIDIRDAEVEASYHPAQCESD